MKTEMAKLILLETMKIIIAPTTPAIKKYLKLAVPNTPIFKTYSVITAPRNAVTKGSAAAMPTTVIFFMILIAKAICIYYTLFSDKFLQSVEKPRLFGRKGAAELGFFDYGLQFLD